ncbi:MAG TPA: hypothetical protein VFQ76_09440 [Longimicrobiaceae bacterium]|nr:hypothetical protein [Longimicrobiaceae bacterium]
MRLFRLALALPLLATAALSLAASDDPTGIGEQVIVTDTVVIGVPSLVPDSVPTALDVISGDQVGIGGGRFPERPGEAEVWDVTVRLQNGTFMLLPRGAVGLESQRAAVTDPITGTTFEGLDEAPSSSRFNTGRGVALTVGSVYVVRSRVYRLSGINCWQFAKVQPVALNAAAGTATLAVATSAGCQDTRLAPRD